MTLTGLYTRHGYVIVDDATERQLYHAGNHRFDAEQPASPGEELPLRTIRKFCIQMGKEIARKRNAVFTGAFRGDE